MPIPEAYQEDYDHMMKNEERWDTCLDQAEDMWADGDRGDMLRVFDRATLRDHDTFSDAAIYCYAEALWEGDV